MNELATDLPAALSAVIAETPGIDWVTDAGRRERLSRDFAWFSPVLTRELAGKTAEAVARPTDEAGVVAVVAACARHGVALTPRGSATGNYGQCTPVRGGVLLDLSGFNALLWQRGGVARAQAGIRMGAMDDQLRPSGWELRCVPSTFRSATLGGLYGGGFGGVGSINHGPLAATGNVLGVRTLTIEPTPRLIELRAPEALLLHHVYGTNGIVLELEVALAPAHPWLEAIVSFDDFDAALVFADTFAAQPGIVKKSVTLFDSAVCALLAQALPYLSSALPAGCHAVPVLVAEWGEQALQELAAAHGGVIRWRQSAAEVVASKRTLVETTWNHTTLHALKVDKAITYIQSGFPAGGHLDQVRALRRHFGDELLVHLEFIRNRDGLPTCSGLQMLRYRDDAQLDAVMQVHRDHGVGIANPHVWRVEDGKQGAINAEIVATKARFDPQGLLNPGKLRGWDERERLLSVDLPDTTVPVLATLPTF
ncbi:FAD-binding oxidoreductase [Sphaerotilus mobilis]|uniref:FAD/FMN-containing dehydrogenase n=1 Tax=Sphaerotilus mobilis TaxID=47994 RepID=A0A4Q7LEU1_9BURK|nr:FAD-binding oxidoreductase [Sphaerotilus mobilis]RZS52097.1 FAD/FMN-containing dehydrogenase [Sphaerotilus mobilis]